jgi:MtN3 and saliva related transmembrane protein
MEDVMDGAEIIGMLAAVLSTLAFLPQAVKTWRTGSADDFSLPTLLMFVTAIALWIIYGVMRAATPVWLANGITIVFATFILVVKLQGVRKSAARKLSRPQSCGG